MTGPDGSSIASMIDECIDWWFRNHPGAATGSGYHRYDALLDDMSGESLLRVATEADEWSVRVSEALGARGLSRTERHDLTILKSHLDASSYELRRIRLWERDPGVYAETLMLGLYGLLLADELPPPRKFECACARLECVPGFFQAAAANLTRPMRSAVDAATDMLPAVVGFINSLGRSLGSEEGDRLDRACALAGAAVQEFAGFVADLAGRAEDDVSIGSDAYAWLLTNVHFLSRTPEELLAFGQRMVADTTRQLEAVAAELVPGGWRQALELVNCERPEADRLVETYRLDVDRIADLIREHNLVTLPDDDTLIVEPTPDFARSLLPYAAYVPPGGFSAGEQAGRFWVTTVDDQLPAADRQRLLGEHNPYSRVFTALHEAYPGHHLQLIFNCRYGTPARRLVMFPTFVEGWAFYCEQMMLDEGCFPDPKYRLWQLRDQLWRAARIVVDVSYHCRGMNVQQAVGYLCEHVGMEAEHALLEARWYANRPSYPMSYMVGKHQLLEIRDRFMAMHGPNLVQFHDRLLQTGGLPPGLAAEVLLDSDGTA